VLALKPSSVRCNRLLCGASSAVLIFLLGAPTFERLSIEYAPVYKTQQAGQDPQYSKATVRKQENQTDQLE